MVIKDCWSKVHFVDFQVQKCDSEKSVVCSAGEEVLVVFGRFLEL